jgi:hypothetical protein
MPFRFRRSTRIGPLRFNFAKSGLSSISLGGRGASFNIPIARPGGARTTVGLPGTGLSWSVEHSPEANQPAPARLPSGPAEGLPNSRRFRPGQLDSFKQGCLGVLQEQLFTPGSQGQLLWELNLITRLLADTSIGSRTQGLLAVIETPEAMEGYLMRAQSQDDAKRRTHRCGGGSGSGSLSDGQRLAEGCRSAAPSAPSGINPYCPGRWAIRSILYRFRRPFDG